MCRCLSHFEIRKHFFRKHQFDLINHEIHPKTSRLTSFITKSQRNFLFKINLDYCGFIFNRTSELVFFGTKMQCNAVVTKGQKEKRKKGKKEKRTRGQKDKRTKGQNSKRAKG